MNCNSAPIPIRNIPIFYFPCTVEVGFFLFFVCGFFLPINGDLKIKFVSWVLINVRSKQV